MNSETTYIERADQADHAALAARLQSDRERYVAFRVEMDAVAMHCIPAARIAKDIGLSFEEYPLPARAELAEAYFNAHYARALGMSFNMFKWFKSTARKLSDKIETMQDVMPAFQLMLWAGEHAALPNSRAPQVSHETTPFNFFSKTLRGLKADLEKQFTAADHWDARTRESIREVIHTTREWMEQLERRL